MANKKVFLFSSEMELIKEYDSINAVAKELETSFANVYLCIKKKGFLLKKYYVSHEDTISIEKKIVK
jgi:molybdenum-dependent DNA-binding transcriptional regulator ModE